jgi:hypothetical protein
MIGLTGFVISKGSSTAFTPRAHGFNPFAFDKTALEVFDMPNANLFI